MKKYLEMFMAFFKIGAFTIGGGYAMLPLIEKEVVERKKWIEREEYLDMIALAQSAPGPIAVNTSVFVGYKVGGALGVLATTLGSVLPSFLIILIIASFFVGIKDNVFVEKAFKGIRPAVVALIAAPVINMSKSAKINRKTIIIPIAVAILVAFVDITPIIIIIVSALGGIFYMRHIGGKKE
ncbi:chromate transporter [Clostridium sp.]|jgi:chromate transporter|uniref:chromate transporter n=1 Tax=Clostridium sp. TaxID=1506 RepID=UPI0039F4FB76